MKVRATAITKSLVEEAMLSPEELIVYIARVSNPSNQLNSETSDKLIKYLIDHKHWSPFEHCSLTVEITTSRAIAAQILRHRSFSFQEFSQRYGEVNEFEQVELRKQASKNRQGTDGESYNPIVHDNVSGEEVGLASTIVENVLREAREGYKMLIDAGVGKEVARMILPLTTTTKIYMTGTIRSWIHYLDIRMEEHTQKEHRDIALEIEKVFKQYFPNVAKALSI